MIKGHVDESPDSPELFRFLLQDRPRFAWPTLLLFLLCVSLFAGSITLALQGRISVFASVALSTIASYISYSIVHEAAHNSISTNRTLNDCIGRVAMLGFSVTPSFVTYRHLHLVHHRFTNDPEYDPDCFCGNGPTWTFPFRWWVMDLSYIATYFRVTSNYKQRPALERFEFWIAVACSSVAIALIAWYGGLRPFLLLYFLPTRLGLFLLAFAFDFLPHYPHRVRVQESNYRATSNRVGLEWLMTPLFVGQNYHLAHHLYPAVPFYRYQRIWKAKKHFHDANQPATVTPFGLLPTGDTPSDSPAQTPQHRVRPPIRRRNPSEQSHSKESL